MNIRYEKREQSRLGGPLLRPGSKSSSCTRQRPRSSSTCKRFHQGRLPSRAFFVYLLCSSLLSEDCFLSHGLSWSKEADITIGRRSKPSFLSRLRTRVTFEVNGTASEGTASTADDTTSLLLLEGDEEDVAEAHRTCDSTPGFGARLLAASRNNILANTLAEQLDSLPSIKDFLKRNTYAENEDADSSADEPDDVTSMYERLLASTKNSTLVTTVTERVRSMPPVRAFLQKSVADSTDFLEEDDIDDDAPNSRRMGVTSNWLASTRNSTLANALAEQIRSIPSVREFLQRQMENNTVSFDLVGALADRILSEESATAVKSIRYILANMEDHGIVDVFSKFPSQDIAASFYALYRLQRAAIRYEVIQEDREPDRHPEDLMHVLDDLSHYVVYATAAYGWKMDLAFQGKLHLGDEHALRRKTRIEKEDIIKLSMRSKAHFPAYFLVRDRERKALVLCIRGTWSAHDVLTDLCCTAEEYQGPACSMPSSSSSSASSTANAGGQRYCAHHGMLEAAMAVAIEMEDIIEEELRANPGFSLVLVGHSMGAGCCSLLATFWEKKFVNMKTYLFGGPCVAPLDSHPTNNTAIINVISEGDPFRCLSLGHIADLSAAVARLCEEPDLRRTVLTRTEGHVHEMDEEDLAFCWETMEGIRNEVMTHADKMFPPGRIFHITKQSSASRTARVNPDEYDSDTEDEPGLDPSSTNGVVIHEVGPEHFRELVICPRMFDITRHRPSLYEDTLRSLIEREVEEGTEGRPSS